MTLTSDPKNSPIKGTPKTIAKRVLKKLVRQFIASNRAASLATVSDDGLPHVAVVYCGVESDLSLYFSTRVESRKFQNLSTHPTVAMAFFDEQRTIIVQLTGIAKQIDDLQQEQRLLGKLITMRQGEVNWPTPSFKMFDRGITNELAIIKVTPTEMTYADFQTTKPGRYKPFFQEVI